MEFKVSKWYFLKIIFLNSRKCFRSLSESDRHDDHVRSIRWSNRDLKKNQNFFRAFSIFLFKREICLFFFLLFSRNRKVFCLHCSWVFFNWKFSLIKSNFIQLFLVDCPDVGVEHTVCFTLFCLINWILFCLFMRKAIVCSNHALNQPIRWFVCF